MLSFWVVEFSNSQAFCAADMTKMTKTRRTRKMKIDKYRLSPTGDIRVKFKEISALDQSSDVRRRSGYR